MRILLLIDNLHWAYHSIAKSIRKYNTSDVNFHIMPIKKNQHNIRKKYKKFDAILVMGWQTFDLVKFLPKKITMVGLHSFHSWDSRKTAPDKDVMPPQKLVDFLNQFVRVNAVSKRLTNLFTLNGVENVFYTPNGVDTQLFYPRNPSYKEIIVGYSGSSAHDWRKGISEFILPAAKKSGIKVKLAMRNSSGHVPLEEMPSFYGNINCYICASSSEGMSLSVLEAAACGCVVISTRCSGSTEIIRDGKNGFLVDREVGDIVSKLQLLKDENLLSKMSKEMAQDIRENWGWDRQSKAWIDFLVGK